MAGLLVEGHDFNYYISVKKLISSVTCTAAEASVDTHAAWYQGLVCLTVGGLICCRAPAVPGSRQQQHLVSFLLTTCFCLNQTQKSLKSGTFPSLCWFTRKQICSCFCGLWRAVTSAYLKVAHCARASLAWENANFITRALQLLQLHYVFT